MPMLIIDGSNGAPPYEQLRQQLITAIRSGELAPETKLPTVRRLAADLGISPNTVARTYQELERARLIETRGRRGTFVADSGDDAEQLRRAAVDYADLVYRLQCDPVAAVELVRAALQLPEGQEAQ
jgi:DNA-binding transcriptional regulator YhcF (GntR family)